MTANHVAVLMGGWASERPVSLSSGNACADGLERAGYKVTRVDMDRDVADVLKKLKPDAVFNALHGPFGEDGTIQGVLELLQLPYTHSGVLASALAMDKEKAKTIARRVGVPVAEAKIVTREEAADKHVMAPPYVIKPVNEGSSFGVLIVREDQSHPPQELYSADWPYGERIMVERYIGGRELTCAVMGNVALGVTEILPQGQGFYDFDAKYTDGMTEHVCPAEIPEDVAEACKEFALRAHRLLGCRGTSRSDFRWDDARGVEGLFLLEVNTQPGMTPLSLVPEQARHMGLDYADLVEAIVADALADAGSGEGRP